MFVIQITRKNSKQQQQQHLTMTSNKPWFSCKANWLNSKEPFSKGNSFAQYISKAKKLKQNCENENFGKNSASYISILFLIRFTYNISHNLFETYLTY